MPRGQPPKRPFTVADSIKGLAAQQDIVLGNIEAYLEFASLGWSNARIAQRLQVSERTIERYARKVRDDPARFLRR